MYSLTSQGFRREKRAFSLISLCWSKILARNDHVRKGQHTDRVWDFFKNHTINNVTCVHVDAELLHNSYWNVFVTLCRHVLLYDIDNVYMVTRSLCLCVYSPGCRSLGHPGCRCFSGSLPRSASCFMRSYCISHRVTYLLFLSHTLIHAHTHTHTLRFSWVWLLLFPQVRFSQPLLTGALLQASFSFILNFM